LKRNGRKANILRLRASIPFSALLIAAALCIGVLCGYGAALRLGDASIAQLTDYFRLYLRGGGNARASLPAVLFCYFRAPLGAFAFAFSALGVVILPLLCAWEAFLLSYSFSCFALALGAERFLTVFGLFSIRLAVFLPALFVLIELFWTKAKALAMLSAASGRRAQPLRYDGIFWSKLAFALLALLFGAVFEWQFAARLLEQVTF